MVTNNILTRIISFINHQKALRSSDSYIKFLRAKGIKIGEGCYIPNPKSVQIDYSRPTLLEIGNNVRLNQDLTIMTHDFASHVFINAYNEFIPSHKKIKIGNNIYFGRKCTVLKGVTIGDNCIIGYGSVIMKDIPNNSVAAGSPAKVICSLDEYFEKRKRQYRQEAIEFGRSIRERYNRNPQIEDFYDDFPAFVNADNMSKYPFNYNRIFTTEQLEVWKRNHQPYFQSFEEFLKEISSQ